MDKINYILKDNYTTKISSKHLNNYYTKYKDHRLSGGTIRSTIKIKHPLFQKKFVYLEETYTDSCSCEVIKKCNIYLGLTICNN